MEESSTTLSSIAVSSTSLSSNNSNDDVTTLRVGDAVQLDDLGPIIINTDGTTTRISNWSSMSQQERNTAIRLISARNKKRIEILKEERDEADQS